MDNNYVNFTTLPEVESAEKKLQRERALAQAMMQQSMQPSQVQMMGRVAVAPSPMEGLAKLANAYFGRKGQERADQSEVELARRKSDIMGQQVEDYVGADSTMTDAERQQIRQAATSNNPMLMQLVTSAIKAKQDLAAKRAEAGIVSANTLAGMSDPSSVLSSVQSGTGIAGFTPKPELQTVDGVVYTVKGGKDGTSLAPVAGNPQYGTEVINGDLYQVHPVTGKRTKLDNAPKVNVSTQVNNLNKGETKFMETLGTKTADAVDTIRNSKIQAQKTTAVVNQLESLDKKGTFSGPTANLATNLSAFADTFGIPVDKGKLGRSQEYAGVLAQQISAYLTSGAGVGRSLTDADREQLEKQFAQLVVTPAGRKRIFNSLRSAAQRDIQYADQVQANLEKSYPEAATLFNLTPAQQTYPQAPVNTDPASEGGVMSLDQYLKGK